MTVPDAWDRLLDDWRPDVVVHLAAETGTSVSQTEASRHAAVNVLGMAQMLDAFVRHDALPATIALASSRAVYGEGAWLVDGEVVSMGPRSHAQLAAGEWQGPGVPLPHRSGRVPERPTSVYGVTKLAQEHLLAAWCAAWSVQSVVLRLQNVYGPGQSLTNPYTGIVPLFAKLARTGGTIPVYEDGQIVRDFIHIDDVVAATVAALETGPSATPYDVGSGVATTLEELARLVADSYGAPAPQVTGQFRDGDVRYAVADPAATAESLRWRPRIAVSDGVPQLCAWIDAGAP